MFIYIYVLNSHRNFLYLSPTFNYHFRFNWTVKAAVLETLALLLAKVEIMLRQFLPQLQTTFLKALNDSNRQVRIKAATAMSFLIKIHTKADPLFSELHLLMKGAEDPAIR